MWKAGSLIIILSSECNMSTLSRPKGNAQDSRAQEIHSSMPIFKPYDNKSHDN